MITERQVLEGLLKANRVSIDEAEFNYQHYLKGGQYFVLTLIFNLACLRWMIVKLIENGPYLLGIFSLCVFCICIGSAATFLFVCADHVKDAQSQLKHWTNQRTEVQRRIDLL